MVEHSRVFTDRQGRPAVQAEILIEAPIETVWATLTDFAAMPGWSDTFQGLEGPFEEGGAVTAVFRLLGRETRIAHPLIYWQDEPERKMFGWSAPTAEGGKIRDDHKYIAERFGPGRTRFVQTDAFSGAGRLTGALSVRLVRRWYRRFNVALKAEAEARAGRPGRA